MSSLLVLPLALALVAGAFAQSQPEEDFKAAAVTRTGHLRFDAAVATVFPLFTPLGEKHWAEGWNPEIVYPRDKDVAEGMVFRTREGVEHVWTVVRYDAANHMVAYNVVAEGMLVRQIKVQCRAAGPEQTEVEVTDIYVALSADGNSFVERLSESQYEKKMGSWKRSIDRYLGEKPK